MDLVREERQIQAPRGRGRRQRTEVLYPVPLVAHAAGGNLPRRRLPVQVSGDGRDDLRSETREES